MKTKNQKSTTKTPPLLAGYIERRAVRCGRRNCRCARGQKHNAHYLVWHCDGQRYRRYIRRADLAETRASNTAHRELQAELREGRARHRALLSRARELIAFLHGAEKAGWRV